MSRCLLERRIAFSSGHRYWLNALSADENRALFGPWASPFNHGHNYVLWVGASGEVDPANGMVVNIKWIDDALKERIIARFDQKSINDEVEGFLEHAPSVENLLLFISRLLAELPGGAQLERLKLEEHPLFFGEWTRDSPMIRLTRIYEFAASHRLHAPALPQEENVRLYGKCNHVHGHGHNYVLEVTVEGVPDERSGMMCDLGALDAAVDRLILDRYDHRNLDLDVPELSGRITTSEVVAQAIFDQLNGRLPAALSRVRLHETARNVFEVNRK